MLALSCCIFQSSMMMVSGLESCLAALPMCVTVRFEWVCM